MATENKKTWDRKGGRPKNDIPRDQQLAVMCTIIERRIIENKARTTGASVSQFLRELALEGQVDSKIKALPKEVLLFTATLNHIAANINQIAKKRNREETFNAIERAEWEVLAGEIKKLAEQIKSYLS
jgi:peptidoglycan hydrolase CwlO-like protein